MDGAKSVYPVYVDMEDWLPIELRELNPKLSDKQLADSAFNVDRMRRLGDFDGIPGGLKIGEREKVFPTNVVEDMRNEFVIFIPEEI